MKINENAIEIVGINDGPISVILAGVHGDERGGIDTFQEILHNLKIQNGKVFFILGNPLAIEKNVRSTESNLNRMFKDDTLISGEEKQTYEYKRAQFLKAYLDQSSALLDIHSSFTPKSQPFIIAEPNSSEITKYLPFNLVVSGFDAVEPGGTDYYMNKKGSIGICIECGYLGNTDTQNIAKDSIFSFLKIRGHLDNVGTVKPRTQSFILVDNIYYTKTNSFTLAKEFEDFEKISSGQRIATDGEETVVCKKDGVILFARNLTEINDEGFLSGDYIKNPYK